MSTILDRIQAYKLDEIAARKAATPLADLEAAARDAPEPRGFARALQTSGGLGLARTSAAHMSPSAPQARFAAVNSPDSETTLDGNAVVVEEQMLKMTESRMAYDAAISLYQKSMQMLRMAARPPGR
jgi:flagellar basal-body rod protein FlgB